MPLIKEQDVTAEAGRRPGVPRALARLAVIAAAALVLFIGNRMAGRGMADIAGGAAGRAAEAEITAILEKSGAEIAFEAVISGGNELVRAVQDVSEHQLTGAKEAEAGDKVVISQGAAGEWGFVDYVRIDGLLILGCALILLMLAFGGLRGFNALLSLGLTCAAVFGVFLPSLLSGKNIYAAALFVCLYSIVATLLIVSGVSRKSFAAIGGCAGSVAVIGALTYAMNIALKLTGLVNENGLFIANLPNGDPIDYKAVIFAGVLIGSVGAMMDVGMTIASSLWEIVAGARALGFAELFRSGVSIGRDIISTMTNTLVLAYLGNSLPALILRVVLSNSFSEMINDRLIVEELLQVIVGCMGLLFAIPLTALIGAALYSGRGWAAMGMGSPRPEAGLAPDQAHALEPERSPRLEAELAPDQAHAPAPERSPGLEPELAPEQAHAPEPERTPEQEPERGTGRIFGRMPGMLGYCMVLLLAIAFLAVGNSVATYGFTNLVNKTDDERRIAEAKVTRNLGKFNTNIMFEATLTSGSGRSSITAVQSTLYDYLSGDWGVKAGDRVIVARYRNFPWEFVGYIRIYGILALGAAFFALLIFFGRSKGINAILSLILTCISVFAVFLPAILSGKNIYLATAAVCVFSIAATLLIANGVNQKTLAAIAGCFIGVVAIGLLARGMNAALNITGVLNRDSLRLLSISRRRIDLSAIVFAGVVVGAIGAVIDSAMSISSALWELKAKVRGSTFGSLMKSGMNIGRDMMGTMANTLILAYMGGSLPFILIMVSNAASLTELLNKERVIVELLQAVAGSIGILLTMPVTALICAAMYARRPDGADAAVQ
ncbi:MAG: YibE/F family protein [Clostridiales bacterium]|jgi:uncharacterized membrane protein|nr:YibE/F family protein [Clostridiales bacterium]